MPEIKPSSSPSIGQAAPMKPAMPPMIPIQPSQRLSTPLIHIVDVTRGYGGSKPLRIADLAVAAAERVVLAGFDAGAAEAFVNLVTGAALPESGQVRIAGRRAPDDPVNLLDADRLAAMTDEELEKELEHMARVIEALDQCGALDGVLEAGGLTRADLFLSIDPDDPNPLTSVRKAYGDYIGTLPPKEQRR